VIAVADTATLVVVAAIAGGIAAACWLLSVLTREYSWVDRIWSIAPVVYVGAYTMLADRLDARLILMTALVGLWGGRLTYNFARKGGYRKGGEDYRWAVLRRKMPRRAYAVFNVVFIAGFQNLLLWCLALPAWLVAQRPARPLGAADFLLAAAFLVFLVGEAIADEQQWAFQTSKREALERGETPSQRFVVTGLFAISRHPNFFCEQMMWWTIGLFAVVAGEPWLSPWLVGPALLTVLFTGSTAFTESITRERYPEYASYQRRVSRLVPWPPRA
jgi:steroid 5-alpha reductase family enzyme